MARFEGEENVPFYSKDVSSQMYGEWKSMPELPQTDDKFLDKFFMHLQSFSEQLKNTKSVTECLKIADEIIQTELHVSCILQPKYDMCLCST